MATSEAQLRREMAFLSYYLSWGPEVVMGLEHAERRRWCEEVSALHGRMADEEGAGEEGAWEKGGGEEGGVGTSRSLASFT